MNRLIIYIVLLSCGFYLVAQETEPKVIQFTGVVFGPDSISVVPGVHVYVPQAGRGTTTNPYGFFSMPVLEGDSVVFSAIGFMKENYVIPKHDSERSLKVIVTLREDVTFLEEVEIFPYPSEAMFKEAVLSVTLPNQGDLDNINAWLSQDYMNYAYANLPASAGASHQYFMDQQMLATQYKFQAPANNLLNPWAWARFIQSLRSGNRQ